MVALSIWQSPHQGYCAPRVGRQRAVTMFVRRAVLAAESSLFCPRSASCFPSCLSAATIVRVGCWGPPFMA